MNDYTLELTNLILDHIFSDVFDKARSLNYNLLLILPTGSYIRHLATSASDLDFFVIIEENENDILNNSSIRKTISFTSNNKKVEIRLLDIRSLYSVIKEGDINIIEAIAIARKSKIFRINAQSTLKGYIFANSLISLQRSASQKA